MTSRAKEDERFWSDRFTKWKDIRAVTFANKTVAANHATYVAAAVQLRKYTTTDLPGKRSSVLEIGYGLGHYTRVCKDVGFETYVGIDFAAPPGPDLGPQYRYLRHDIGLRLDLGRKFELVTAIDVLFHITDEARFEAALDNLQKHASKFIYVTGLMRDKRFKNAPQVVCRDLSRFKRLGRLVRLKPWRDNSIACFAI